MGTGLQRPKALTPEVQRKLVALVADGNYFAPACIAAGTTRQTVEYWQRLHDEGAEHAQEYADFFAALARARAIAETNAVADLKTGRPGWQAQAWFLERRYPSRWLMKRQTQKVEVKQEVQSVPVVILPDNQRDPRLNDG